MLTKMLINPTLVRWFHNGHWTTTPHKFFLKNNLAEAAKKQHAMPYGTYLAACIQALKQGKVVHANNIVFKLEN